MTIRLVRNTAIYAVGGLLPQAINVLLLPVLTRYLTRDDLGILSYTSAVCGWIGIIGSLTLHTYLLRNYYACRTDAERGELFSTLFTFLCGYNAALLAIEWLVLPPIFAAAGVKVAFAPYFQLALLATALEAAAIIPLTRYRVREEPLKFVMLAGAATLLNAVAVLYFVVYRHGGVVGRYAGQLSADVVMLLVYGVLIIRSSGLHVRRQHVVAALGFCLPLVPAQLFGSFDAISDRLILERFVPIDRLGVYGVALMLSSGLQLLSGAMYKAIEPPIYRLANAGALDARIAGIKRHVRVAYAIGGGLLIAFSRELVQVLTGPAFHDSYRILAVLAVAVAFRGFSGVLSTYLLAIGISRVEAVVRFTASAAGIAAGLFLVPRLGIIGAAWAAVCSSLVSIAAFALVLQWRRPARWALPVDVVALSATFAAAGLLLSWQAGNVFVTVVTKAGLCALAAGTAVWIATRGDARIWAEETT